MPRLVRPAPSRPNERWSMDFVQDQLASGKRFRMLNVVYDFTRECLAIEVDTSAAGAAVVRVLERLVQERGLPETIVSDNGPEFVGRALDAGRTSAGSSCSSSGPGSRSRTPTSRASKASCVTSASTRTGSPTWRMRGRRSRRGGSTSTARGRTRRWAT